MVKFFVIVLLAFYSNCFSQALLFQKNRFREAQYEIGDILTFRLRDTKSKISLRITGFEDSLIVFKNFKITPKEITHLYADSKTKIWYILRFMYKRIFVYAGVGYLLLDVLNTGELSEETLMISSSLISAGLLARLLISERIKIKGRRKLIIIG